jgi:PAS domain S-box-containing protein
MSQFDTENIRVLYSEGLEKFLTTRNEECLTQAYNLGRESLRLGLSELDIIEFHHDSLSKVNGSLNDDGKFHSASTYLKEWLAPYEVKLQSFQDVIKELNRKNKQLTEEIENRREIQNELVESKEYFQLLLENGQDIITVLDQRGIIRYTSPSVYRILNYSQNRLVGSDVINYIHESDQKRVKRILKKILKTPGHVESIEFRFLHQEGHWIYLESIIKHVPESRDGPVLVVNSRDTTERRYNMQTLKEHKARLAEAQRIAKVGSWEWKPGEEPDLSWSDEMCRIYGYNPSDFDHSYETYLDHVHPDDRERIVGIIEDALKKKRAFSFEHKIIRLDGEVLNLLCRGRSVTNQQNEVVKMIGTCQDVTEQKLKEQKLREYSQKLRRLTEKIERTREEERIRIAREIHDELGQMLTVLKMDISMLSGQMKKKVSTEVLGYFNSEAEKILNRINTIIKSVQRITTDLRPEVLDDLGLREAIEWQSKEFEKRTGTLVNFISNIGDTDFLSDVHSTTLFRILQETLTNIIRHAEASRVDISFIRRNNNIYLAVEDNGVGITEEQKEAPTSFGIIGMRERTQFLGGDVEIKGDQEKGTTVTVRLPLDVENSKY